MENFFSFSDLILVLLVFLMILIVPIADSRKRLPPWQWICLTVCWAFFVSAAVYLVSRLRLSFRYDDWLFWLVSIAVFFLGALCAARFFSEPRPDKAAIRKMVIEEAATYLRCPSQQISCDIDLFSYRDDFSQSDILLIVLMTERKLGIFRSGGISNIRTIDDIVNYLSGQNIHPKKQ